MNIDLWFKGGVIVGAVVLAVEIAWAIHCSRE
jgi:hypothetical protein